MNLAGPQEYFFFEIDLFAKYTFPQFPAFILQNGYSKIFKKNLILFLFWQDTYRNQSTFGNPPYPE